MTKAHIVGGHARSPHFISDSPRGYYRIADGYYRHTGYRCSPAYKSREGGYGRSHGFTNRKSPGHHAGYTHCGSHYRYGGCKNYRPKNYRPWTRLPVWSGHCDGCLISCKNRVAVSFHMGIPAGFMPLPTANTAITGHQLPAVVSTLRDGGAKATVKWPAYCNVPAPGTVHILSGAQSGWSIAPVDRIVM